LAPAFGALALNLEDAQMRYGMIENLVRRAFPALLLSVLAGMASPLLAQSAPDAAAANTNAARGGSMVTQSHEFGSWSVRCYKQPSGACDISQASFERTRKIRLLRISIIFAPQNNAYLGRFTVPLGVAFDKGMTIAVGSYRLPNLQYRRCERDGCYVEGGFPTALIDAMSASGAGKGAVEVFGINGRQVSIPIALDGFADGLAQLRQWAVVSKKAAPSDAAKP
jgi:invasion protein IalB